MSTGLLLIAFYTSLLASVIATAYVNVLIRPGHILHRPFLWLRNLLTTIEVEEQILDVPDELVMTGQPAHQYRLVEKRKESPILKPLGGCEMCMAGQLSLWLYAGFAFGQDCLPKTFSQTFLFLIHIIFSICLSLLLTKALQRLFRPE